MALRIAPLTSNRPSPRAPGENPSLAARIPTNADPHSVTVTSPATSAAASVRSPTVAVIPTGKSGRGPDGRLENWPRDLGPVLAFVSRFERRDQVILANWSFKANRSL